MGKKITWIQMVLARNTSFGIRKIFNLNSRLSFKFLKPQFPYLRRELKCVPHNVVHPGSHSSIQKYLTSGYYVPSPLLSTGDTAVNVLGNVPTLKELGEG